jgi:hypothetical protein
LSSAYIKQQAFATLVGVGFLVSGILLVLWPDAEQTLIGVPGLIRSLWHLSYAIGGALLCYGIFRLNPKCEAAGHAMIGSVFLSTIYFMVRDAPPGSLKLVLPGLALVTFLIAGSLLRFWTLYRQTG